MARPRVLFLACHLPFPPLSGGRRRELEMIRRLSRDFDLHLIVASKTFEQDRANVAQLERYCRRVEVFRTDPMPPELRARDEPPQVLRHRCPGMTRRVAALLSSDHFDLLHVEGFYLMQHVPPSSEIPSLLVEQNIEFDLERQQAGTRRGVRDMRTLRAELEAWRRATLVGVLTPEDREMLRAALPGAHVRLVPDGADHLPPAEVRVRPLDRPAAPLLVFLANFGYAPNVDAATHLCHDILPKIQERVPNVQLWLVGTDPPPEVQALAGDTVRVTGRVRDVVPYIDAADVVLCPLRIGGGIKVKAIEALRRGRCVVSSSIGAQGIPAGARKALAIADDPAEFAVQAATLLLDPNLRRRQERESELAARLLPSWDDAAAALAEAYAELLGQSAELAVGA